MAKTTLTVREVFDADDLNKREFVPTPEWAPASDDPEFNPHEFGVFVKTMDLKTRRKVRKLAETKVKDRSATGGVRTEMDAEMLEAYLVVFTACDEKGSLIFNQTHAEALLEKSGGPINRIARKAMELSGMLVDEEDVENL